MLVLHVRLLHLLTLILVHDLIRLDCGDLGDDEAVAFRHGGDLIGFGVKGACFAVPGNSMKSDMLFRGSASPSQSVKLQLLPL